MAADHDIRDQDRHAACVAGLCATRQRFPDSWFVIVRRTRRFVGSIASFALLLAFTRQSGLSVGCGAYHTAARGIVASAAQPLADHHANMVMTGSDEAAGAETPLPASPNGMPCDGGAECGSMEMPMPCASMLVCMAMPIVQSAPPPAYGGSVTMPVACDDRAPRSYRAPPAAPPPKG